MIHNSVIIEFPGSSRQQEAVLATAAAPLERALRGRTRLTFPSTWTETRRVGGFLSSGLTESEARPDPGDEADRRRRACARSVFKTLRRLNFTPTTNSTSQQNSPSARSDRELLPNKQWSELKNKQTKNHGSLWRRVNKPTVGGGHRTEESKSKKRSSVQESNRRQRRTQITRPAWGMFHIILLFFTLFSL